MEDCSVKQTLLEKANKDISFLTDVREEWEERTKAENVDKVKLQDVMKSMKTIDGEEIIEKLQTIKDLELCNDLEVETLLENLSLSNTKHKIILCRVKDEEVVDVMQMELESDTEDLSGKTIEHVEENKTGGKDEESNSSSSSVTTQAQSASNFATNEFICELKVDPKLNNNKNKIAMASQALSGKDLDNIDIRGIVRKLLKTSCDNCTPKLAIDEKLTEDIVRDLYNALIRPSKELDMIILLIVPAVAIDENSGAILGYGIVHLMGHGNNYMRRSKIFRGYARNAETFQSIFKIINGSLN